MLVFDPFPVFLKIFFPFDVPVRSFVYEEYSSHQVQKRMSDSLELEFLAVVISN